MYDLSMHDLEIILAVAEAGSFRRAALQMGKGQSAVSRRIQRLEDEFGASIFERRSTGARLTNAGVLFVESSRRILREYQAAFASEPPRVCRRLVDVSYAAISEVSRAA